METAKLGPLAFYKVPPRGAWVGLWGGWERRWRSVVVEPELSRALPPAAQLLHAPGPVLAPERCEPWPPLGSLPGSGFCSSSAVVRVPDRSAGPGSNAPALADHCRRWSVLGPEVQGWVQSPVSHLAPGRAPEVGFQTRGFFQLWPVRRPPLQPVCSSSPGSVHSPSDPGAVGSDPGFYRDSAYVVVMPALMCLGAEGLMHAADTCVHSDGCGASPAAPAASCLPPRPRLLGARAACPASLPRACKFVLLPVGWAAGHPWPRRGSRRPGTC